MRFAVPSGESAWLVPGCVVSLRTEGSPEPLRAEVRQVAPEIDSVSGMIFAEAAVLDRAMVGNRLPIGTVVRILAPNP